MLSSIARFLLPLLLALSGYSSPLHVEERAVLINSTDNLEAAYDYVIIGGGTSGLTVADRLTEDANSMSLPTDPVLDA